MISDNQHRKKRNAIIFTILELILSVVQFSLALSAYLIVTNSSAGCFWAPVPLILACPLFFVGVASKENGQTWMMAGLILNIIGALLVFVGVVIDSVQAGYISNTDFSRCSYTNHNGMDFCFGQGVLYTINSQCPIHLKERSCYCCYIYRESNCNEYSFSLSSKPDTFVGVDSCDEVKNDYQGLLWADAAVGIANLIIAIATCAMINMYKSQVNSVSPQSTRSTMPVRSAPVFRTQVMSADNPVHIWSAHRHSVGYYPQGAPVLLKPPEYSAVVRSGERSVRTARRESMSNNNMPPVLNPDPPPPPYSP